MGVRSVGVVRGNGDGMGEEMVEMLGKGSGVELGSTDEMGLKDMRSEEALGMRGVAEV